nr:hypothetical protein [Shewanella shenzhenensis]
MSANVTFFGSEVVGLDSWKRTGNCTLEVVDKNVTLEYHWGLGLFQQTFRIMNINVQEMSGGFRIKDNSVHMNFTIYNFGDKELCYLAFHDLSYERLAGVDFYSSRAEYDGID